MASICKLKQIGKISRLNQDDLRVELPKPFLKSSIVPKTCLPNKISQQHRSVPMAKPSFPVCHCAVSGEDPAVFPGLQHNTPPYGTTQRMP